MDELINAQHAGLKENHIQTIHGLVMKGRKKETPYRDGQNVIRDGFSGKIVYMPPEAQDVPLLMQEMVRWINNQIDQRELPAPLIAGIAHYQFATIHPYYDGNGRTARLLTNLILHQSGYGLKGIYSLEEYYAKNLQGYYEALTVGPSHNYYFGRVEADITKWIVYFCEGMANAFAKVRLKATEAEKNFVIDQSFILRDLDHRQKQILSLFKKDRFLTTRQMADFLKIHPRTMLNVCNKWVQEGFLLQHGTSAKNRHYELSHQWVEFLKQGSF